MSSRIDIGYRDIPTIHSSIKKCDKCGHIDVELPHLYSHASMCEYYYYRDIKRHEDKFEMIETDDSFYVKLLFDVYNIKYVGFYVYGEFGRYYELYTDGAMAGIISWHNKNKNFADLTVEDVITSHIDGGNHVPS